MGSEKEKTTNSKEKIVLEIEDLKLSFGEKKVLKGFDLKLKEGEILAVMGKSGSGKSVLIKCAVGLIPFNNGRIKVLDKDISTLNHGELDELRAEIGFLFQDSALYDSMTVRQNLEFPLRRHKKKEELSNTDELVKKTLDQVGLADAIDEMPEELSGGMRRRVAMARALILQPKIIFYDEPTAGLDPITSREITSLMTDIQEKYNTSSLLITHDVDSVERIADRVILLLDGKNYTEGTFGELSSSEDPRVNEFFK